MSRFVWTIVVCFIYFLDHLTAHTNPCPEFWRYVKKGGNYQGILTVLNPPRNGNLKVRLVLSITGYLPTDYEGSINLVTDESTAIRDIQAGRKLEYQVQFPIQDPLPVLLDFSINGQTICRGYKAHGPIATSIKLFHTLNKDNRGSVAPSSSAISFPNQPAPSTHPNPNDEVCGEVYNVGQSLVVNGASYKRGDFPWLSALFLNNKFICAGTLVTSNHVITAAHCIHNKDDNRKQFRDMHFVLGAHNLNEQDLVIKQISTFITHPDWDPDSEVYDADIALADLTSTVQFTKYIRPACLFNPEIHSENIEGQIGTLAGWGRIENDEFATDNPRTISIPVVSDEDCLRSNPVFARITSQRTFCAGSPGKGPCEGDSGGGLMIPAKGKWVLRGIISASLKGNVQRCNVDEFAVFTDVAKHDRWIRNFIE